jgi:hypothetical protein
MNDASERLPLNAQSRHGLGALAGGARAVPAAAFDYTLDESKRFFESMRARRVGNAQLLDRLLARCARGGPQPRETAVYRLEDILCALSLNRTGRSLVEDVVAGLSGLDGAAVGAAHVHVFPEHHTGYYPLRGLPALSSHDTLTNVLALSEDGLRLWFSLALETGAPGEKLREFARSLRRPQLRVALVPAP